MVYARRYECEKIFNFVYEAGIDVAGLRCL